MSIESIEPLTSPSAAEAPPLRRFRARAWCGRIAQVTFLCLIFASAVSAQVTANLSGTVTDQSGATVSGADVTVKNVETGAIRNTTTGDSGRYQVFALPIGAYEVRVTRQGFAEQIRTGIRLVVGQDARVDVTLSVGPVSQRITVNSDAPLVSVSTADVPGLVGEQQVKDLPLNGRSYDLLVTLNPGIVNLPRRRPAALGSRTPPRETTLPSRATVRSRISFCSTASNIPALPRTTCNRVAPASSCWAWMRYASLTSCATPTAPNTASTRADK